MMTTVAYWAAVCTISIPALVLTAYSDEHGLWPTSLFEWAVVLYSGVISSALNYYLLVFATTHLAPLTVSIYGLIQPILTDIFNFVFVGKGLSRWDAIGSLLIILSVL